MNSEEATDESLMLAYGDGDLKAFEVLYGRHKGPLYRFILRQCGNTSIADELFQDVWGRLVKARENYRVSAKFKTWLYQIAQNRLIDYYRKESSRKASSHSSSPLEELLVDEGEQPEVRAELNEKALTLMRCVENLPASQKQAFLLKQEAGLSLGEIAEVMGVNAETAKSRLRYALQKLRSELND